MNEPKFKLSEVLHIKVFSVEFVYILNALLSPFIATESVNRVPQSSLF
jgi:hypothetical protein